MDERDWLTERFAEHRSRLRAVAYRMLGSLTEADDALQEAWLRVSRADTSGVDNLPAWLTTVVARVCLNALRSRETRREDPLDVHMPDPVVTEQADPEREAILSDAVGLAMLVVLDSLVPAERVAFVLHDMFAVPFEEIGRMLGRTPAATRQLASRARRRIRDVPAPDPDVPRQREVVTAFFAAARDGDLPALVAVLDPDVVLRADAGRHRHQTMTLRGATQVAAEAARYRALTPLLRPVLVNGAAGVVVATGGRALSVMAFTVTDGRITAIDVLSDQERLAALGI